MATKQFIPPVEAARPKKRMPLSSEPAALRSWAAFLAPKEVEPMRLFSIPHHGSNRRVFRLDSATESVGGRVHEMTEQPYVEAAQQHPLGGAPSNPSRFAARVLRDRFPADIEEQIEQAWGD